jgi:hypothetical protein
MMQVEMGGECDVKGHMWNMYRILVESVKTGDDLNTDVRMILK